MGGWEGVARADRWCEEYFGDFRKDSPEYADDVALRFAVVFDRQSGIPVRWAERIENPELQKRVLLASLLWSASYDEAQGIVQSMTEEELEDPLTRIHVAFALANWAARAARCERGALAVRDRSPEHQLQCIQQDTPRPFGDTPRTRARYGPRFPPLYMEND